ncbi:hypothetical protein BpHYR1_021031, partial [Brachionus plicatilis]
GKFLKLCRKDINGIKCLGEDSDPAIRAPLESLFGKRDWELCINYLLKHGLTLISIQISSIIINYFTQNDIEESSSARKTTGFNNKCQKG